MRGKVVLFRILLSLSFLMSAAEGGERPPHISKGVWMQVKPYLLPEDHPAKKALDDIFSKRRAVLSGKTMKKAGFFLAKPQEVTRLIVTGHPQLQGYLVKTYLDAQKARKNRTEEYFWLLRIQGANAIREIIEREGWQEMIKVPRKWIYPLPKEPAPPPYFQRINFVLIEEDMNILGAKDNLRRWGSSAATSELLEKIVMILETLGLRDCAKPDNIPFSHDGRVAFVDTQTHHEWPVEYKKLNEHLSPSMKSYLKKLVRKK